MSNHQELRRAAECATPGPWRSADGGFVVMAGDVTDEDSEMVVDCADTSFANTNFIAEANPRVILDLLDELDHAKAVGWRSGYADGRDDMAEGVPGASSNPYE